MRSMLFVAVLATLVAGAVAHGGGGGDGAIYGENSPVAQLTPDNFDEQIKSLGRFVLVEFYAPWCGHCKSLKPAYEQAAAELKASGVSGALAAVDADAHGSLGEKFGVQGFPTIVLFENGEKVEEYQGGRSAEAFVSFIESRLLPEILTADSAEQLAKIQAKQAVTVIGHFAPENDAARKAFLEACTAARKQPANAIIRCVEVASGAVAGGAGIEFSPAVRLVRKAAAEGEASSVDFDFFSEEGFNAEKIAAFLSDNAFPVLAEITPDNYESYEKRGLPFLWFFHPGHGVSPSADGEEPEANAPEVDAARVASIAAARAAAKSVVGKLSAVYLSGADYQEHAVNMGCAGEAYPCAVIQKDSEKYVLNTGKALSADELSGFLAKWVAGTLPRHVKSEPVPADNSGPVRTVVGTTFDAEVYDSDSDVFIEFYAPWCGHCKSLAPIWKQLGTALQGVKGIVIAQMDATANDAPSNIKGFPTLYFKKAGDKEHRLADGMFYDGERTRDAMLAYIKKHSSADLSAIKLPADLTKIKAFLAGFEGFKDNVERLLEENADLKAKLGITADDADEHDHEGHDHHDHDHEGHHHDHDEL